MSIPQVTTKRHASLRPPAVASSVRGNAEAPVTSPPVPRPAHVPVIDPDALRQIIAEVAYYRAEQRGFTPGGELQDWLEAEAQVAARRGA